MLPSPSLQRGVSTLPAGHVFWGWCKCCLGGVGEEMVGGGEGEMEEAAEATVDKPEVQR